VALEILSGHIAVVPLYDHNSVVLVSSSDYCAVILVKLFDHHTVVHLLFSDQIPVVLVVSI